MQIVFSCANCGRKFEKDVSLAGKKGRCKDCGHVFVIPTPSRMPQPAPARAPQRVAAAGDTDRPTSARGPQPSSTWPDSHRQKPRPAPSPAAPIYAEAIDDPYGLDDVPAVLPEAEFASAASEEEELAVPRRIAPTASQHQKRRSSRRGESSGFFGGLPGIVYLIVLVALVFGFLCTLVHPRIGAYVFAVNSVLSFLVLFIYGFVGVTLLPFRDSVTTGILCWVCPPYLLGYVYRERDTMGGVFLSLVASFVVAIFMGIAAPLASTLRNDRPPMPRNQPAAVPASFAAPPPVGFAPPASFPGPPAPPFRAPRFAPPPGVQPPAMTNTITLSVSGLDNQAAGKAFGDKLTELVGKVSGGFRISGSGGGGRSIYSIAMKNSVDVPAFADQITWARVTRVSGQTIEIDASAL